VVHGLQEFRKLAGEMLEEAPVDTGPRPDNLISKQLSLLPGIVVDLAPPGIPAMVLPHGAQSTRESHVSFSLSRVFVACQ